MTAFSLRKSLLAVAAAFGLAGVGMAAQELFDAPAINVFPDHDAIGHGYSIQRAIQDGRKLFMARFNLLDGAGRPYATMHNFPTARSDPGPGFQRVAGPDANSCSGCHNQPVVGGSGDFVTNVFVGAPQFGSTLTDSISAVFSNERNTRSLFGIGGVETLAVEMSQELISQRDAALDRARKSGTDVNQPLSAKGVKFGTIRAMPNGDVDFAGLEGISPDLVVKPFGTKGTVTSIREFTIVALNQHHGIEPTEFFGEARTGTRDFDQDGVPDEFSVGQTTALSLFQATLPAPVNKGFEKHPGFAVFKQLGCDSCHVPKLYIKNPVFQEPNIFNREGVLAPADTKNVIKTRLDLPRDANGYYINAFTDLKRHVMCDDKRKQLCNETKKQDKVPLKEFMTTRLWDLNTSAPYCHRGDCTTLTEAIRAHGGEAGASVDRFEEIDKQDKLKLIAFLQSLGSSLPKQK
jgi:Di-haem oxidoreductase, putative peroxidase